MLGGPKGLIKIPKAQITPFLPINRARKTNNKHKVIDRVSNLRVDSPVRKG